MNFQIMFGVILQIVLLSPALKITFSLSREKIHNEHINWGNNKRNNLYRKETLSNALIKPERTPDQFIINLFENANTGMEFQI